MSQQLAVVVYSRYDQLPTMQADSCKRFRCQHTLNDCLTTCIQSSKIANLSKDSLIWILSFSAFHRFNQFSFFAFSAALPDWKWFNDVELERIHWFPKKLWCYIIQVCTIINSFADIIPNQVVCTSSTKVIQFLSNVCCNLVVVFPHAMCVRILFHRGAIEGGGGWFLERAWSEKCPFFGIHFR